MKNAVIYARYSSVMQTEQSIEGQTHVCEGFAADNGLRIIGSYIDRARSATNDDRPEFQRMIKDSKGGKFEVVLVYKLDRFARNRYDSALYKKKLRDNGVRVVSATENITDSPEGIIMEGLIESMDQYYSAELSRKCKRGLKESFAKGRYLGAVTPFGYKVVDHKLVLDELTAPVAREIFERCAKGDKYGDIIADLNHRGIRNANGNEWNRLNITKILTRTLYKGEYRVSTLDGFVPCPAAVSAELFDKAQAERARRIHAQRDRRTDYKYLLTGRTFCGVCGKPVCGHSIQQGKYHYYRCSVCYKRHFNADKLHETVRSALAEYLTADKVEQLAQAAYNEYKSANAPATDAEILSKELAAVEKQIQNALSAILSGFKSETLKTTLEELEIRKASILAQMESVQSAPPKLTLDHFRFALTEIVKKADTDNFRQLVDTVVGCIVIDDKKAVICINLTDEDNEPPVEQILLRGVGSSVHHSQSKVTLLNNWLLISA